MTAAIILTPKVRHLAVWVADPERSRDHGFTVGSTRPICGAVTAFAHRAAPYGGTGRFEWLDDSDDDHPRRKVCTRCEATMESLALVLAAARERT